MIRTTIWTVVLTLTVASAAEAASAAAQCQAAKVNALRKRDHCLAGEQRNAVLGKTPNTAKCAEKFAKAIAAADKVAVKKNVPCRWIDHADGTAKDLNTGLTWELKTDDGGIHDKDDRYMWSATFGGTTPSGTAFTDFLHALNDGTTTDTITTIGCFADHCDWRVPTLAELTSILDAPNESCAGCTSIPGSIGGTYYWSSTTSEPAGTAWMAFFLGGSPNPVAFDFTAIPYHVRAVRSGSEE